MNIEESKNIGNRRNFDGNVTNKMTLVYKNANVRKLHDYRKAKTNIKRKKLFFVALFYLYFMFAI